MFLTPRPRGPHSLRALFPLFGLLCCASAAQAARCGTALYFERLARGEAAHPGKGLKAASHAAVDNRARTLVSDNFLIHYSLRAWHRVHTETGDTALVKLTDSLYAVFASLPPAPRDSAVYARLDSAGAPHPLYIQKLKQYSEAARAYYVGKLGMPGPVSSVLSVQYNVPASLPRRFPIDVVDVGTADPAYAGETYAITYPPSDLSISFENDFICNTTLDEAGRIHGQDIQSRLGAQVIHDYANDWELGIKVTAFHEFYHAVQFTYIPRVTSYHAWYEISATGMEERKAPEVDDYLQYLPCILKNHDRVPLTSTLAGPCTHYPMYGHSIFHQYLTRALDSTFDVKVWEQLSHNGDALRDGLEATFAKYGKTTTELYSEYAAETFFAGKRFAIPAPQPWSTGPLFSDDTPKWPDIVLDSVDLAGDPYRTINLAAMTYGVLKVKWGAGATARILQAKVAAGITRIHANADTSIVEALSETQLTLGPPRAGFNEYYLVLPNPSFTDKATIEIKDPDAEFYAFPNPASVGDGLMGFSQAKGMTFPAEVRIYSEAGKLVRSLEFADDLHALDWNLRDANGNAVKPGVYYYRLGTEALKTLVLLR